MPAPAAPAVWTVLALIQSTTDLFAARGIDGPRLTAELLLGRVLGLERIRLYTNFDRPVDERERAAFRELVRRRLGREPLQYILGETGFMGMRFAVDRDVLIPRPETEQLVELVLALERETPGAVRSVLDIGTGSGNIAVSIAKLVPGCRVDALEISPGALRVARGNASALGAADRVAFIEGDILDEDCPLPGAPYDVVAANPPYISSAEYALLEPEVREFEPEIATTDRGDGLTFYRAIARRFREIVRPGGRLFAEVAYDQHAAVAELFRAAGCADVEALPDHQGIPRIIRAGRA